MMILKKNKKLDLLDSVQMDFIITSTLFDTQTIE